MAVRMLELLPGSTLGSQKILAKLATGGMATLYLARRESPGQPGREVVVKVLQEHLAKQPQLITMFLDEARLATRIDHPHVVDVMELGDANGAPYIVMEFVHGCSLQELFEKLAWNERQLSNELVAYIGARVAEALHAAHETTDEEGRPLGVVHRDVSPQNVLISSDGVVKLIDFGIAKVRNRSAQTRTGLLKGKISYMAPEQARGRPLDPRTDVYALGIVLWQLLTGRRLFQGDDDFALLDEVRDPDIPLPSRLVEGVDPALEAAVMHALEKAPDARPKDAAAFARELSATCPESAGIGPSAIQELLWEVASDLLDERSKLSLQRPGPPRGPTGQAMKTLTIPARPGSVVGADPATAPRTEPEIAPPVIPSLASGPDQRTVRSKRNVAAPRPTPGPSGPKRVTVQLARPLGLDEPVDHDKTVRSGRRPPAPRVPGAPSYGSHIPSGPGGLLSPPDAGPPRGFGADEESTVARSLGPAPTPPRAAPAAAPPRRLSGPDLDALPTMRTEAVATDEQAAVAYGSLQSDEESTVRDDASDHALTVRAERPVRPEASAVDGGTDEPTVRAERPAPPVADDARTVQRRRADVTPTETIVAARPPWTRWLAVAAVAVAAAVVAVLAWPRGDDAPRAEPVLAPEPSPDPTPEPLAAPPPRLGRPAPRIPGVPDPMIAPAPLPQPAFEPADTSDVEPVDEPRVRRPPRRPPRREGPLLAKDPF